MLRVIYGNGNPIVQAPGMVIISYEMVHDTRVDLHRRPAARLPRRPPVPRRLARRAGKATTLVVETTNFTDKTSIGPNGNGLRHSDR